ncbi:hypothetical protein Tco_1030986 [Tanacetum coccineum]|uniref:Reverse transcriptase domain-containing protein n=1 Tax=Tanacetum coccineum TaxID=301880 RepID=A0ABQ5G971_9ASTR
MYHDNIQEYVSQAAAANFNQANSGYRPPMVSNQIRPPGFPPVQNPHANSQNNFNRGNNFNQNRETISHRYVTANDAVLRNMQNQGQNLQSQMANLTDMLSKFVTANTASTSGSGTLPGNTITNPKEDLKVNHHPPPKSRQYMPGGRKELKLCEAKAVESSVNEPPEVELKELPPHLEYAFLEGDDKLPVIIAKDLKDEEKAP